MFAKQCVAWGIVAAFFLGMVCAGCARRAADDAFDEGNACRGDLGVELERVEGLRVGMSEDEVRTALGLGTGGMGPDVPALLFGGRGGVVYYAVFYNAHAPTIKSSGLQYVVSFPTIEMTQGRYVFPPKMKGTKYVFPVSQGIEP